VCGRVRRPYCVTPVFQQPAYHPAHDLRKQTCTSSARHQTVDQYRILQKHICKHTCANRPAGQQLTQTWHQHGTSARVSRYPWQHKQGTIRTVNGVTGNHRGGQTHPAADRLERQCCVSDGVLAPQPAERHQGLAAQELPPQHQVCILPPPRRTQRQAGAIRGDNRGRVHPDGFESHTSQWRFRSGVGFTLFGMKVVSVPGTPTNAPALQLMSTPLKTAARCIDGHRHQLLQHADVVNDPMAGCSAHRHAAHAAVHVGRTGWEGVGRCTGCPDSAARGVVKTA